jgi:pimeloyl-ACP methyl ester carboxylesterase
VVTALELRLHPVAPDVLAGFALHPPERGPELLALFRDVMAGAPDGLGIAVAYVTAPDEPEVPRDLRGRTTVILVGMHAGPVAEGEEALRELREFGPPVVDAFAPTTYADFQCALDDPPGYRNWWTAEHLHDLSADAIELIHRRALDKPPGPAQLFVVPWGGRVAAVGEDESPLRGRDARFVVHPLVMWGDPADDERAIAWGRGFREDLRDHATGGAYLNFTGDEGDARVRAQYGERCYRRLARVKAAMDPDDVFRAGGHVAPAAPAAPADAGAILRRPPQQARLADGIVLLYVEQGAHGGAPVVLLHGLSDHWRSFAPVLAHMPPAIRAFAVTQRGHAGASQPETGYAIADLARDVIGFLDAVGVERAVVAGHSLGALAALQTAIDAPDRVSGIVLAPGFARVPRTAGVVELLRAVHGLRDPIDPGFAAMLQEQARDGHLPPGFFEAMVAHTQQMPARVWRALVAAVEAFDVEAPLGRVRAPALLMWGPDDAIVDRGAQDRLLAGLPDAGLHVYAGAGHTPHWHDPARFARDVAAFAQQPERGADIARHPDA